MPRSAHTKRFAAVAALAIALASVLVSCSCSVSIGGKKTGGTYSGHGVSFKIPDGWRTGSGDFNKKTGNELWKEAFGPADGNDAVFVAAYATNYRITNKNAAHYSTTMDSTITNLARAGGGSVLSGPENASIGNMVGYRFAVQVPTSNGATLRSKVVMVWNGKTEYFLNCQYVVGGSRKAEITRGCDTIINSFKLD